MFNLFGTKKYQDLRPELLPDALKQEPGEILDVRTPGEFQSGHLKNARNLDYLGGQFAQALVKLDKNKAYYLYCASGGRSGSAASQMAAAGFTKVYNLGGYSSCVRAGLK
jgi:phage shock protein E